MYVLHGQRSNSADKGRAKRGQSEAESEGRKSPQEGGLTLEARRWNGPVGQPPRSCKGHQIQQSQDAPGLRRGPPSPAASPCACRLSSWQGFEEDPCLQAASSWPARTLLRDAICRDNLK